MNKYGHFTQDKREFIITRPDTPAPWINYLSNGRYHGIISQTAGGFSYYRDPANNRITRLRYNSLPIDRPGRYIILRDKPSGVFWSPTWQPTQTRLEKYECRHGLYYTIISSLFNDIECSILYFVPLDDDLEIWRVRLRNMASQKKVLDVFAYNELALGHAMQDITNQPNDQHFNQVHFDRDNEVLLASKRHWLPNPRTLLKQVSQVWNQYIFFASSLPIRGWDGSKDMFIGRWRSESNPIAVEQGRCFDSEITTGDAIAALQSEILLPANEEIEFNLLMGILPRENYQEEVVKYITKYRNIETVDKEYARLRAEWKEYISHVQVDTPDDDMNAMLNIWNQYQNAVTFTICRDASYHHNGLQTGRKVRDSCEDVLGPIIPRPDWIRTRILEMTQHQFRNGRVFDHYFPNARGGELSGQPDTPLWLPLAIIVYLKETADFSILKERSKFYDQDEATVLEHLYAAINYALTNLSDRHLAKFATEDGIATLSDIDCVGRGESVWATMFLGFILRETIDLCKHIGDEPQVAQYIRAHQIVATAVNLYCWDGEWYTCGTDNIGTVIGSRTNQEGQIFLNSQSWAVISGIADEARALSCMNAVVRHLDTLKGPKILHPAFKEINANIGLATHYAAGKKENGAICNHPLSWAILAECLLGRGDRAYAYYKKALPMNPVINIDRYQAEPYVYAEYVTSPDHPTYGQASHSWLTGASAWMLRDAIDYILGVRPVYQGLMIDPCIPNEWQRYRISRKFRGKIYDIYVRNPIGVNKGVRMINVNNILLQGTVITSDFVKQFPDETLRIEVELG